MAAKKKAAAPAAPEPNELRDAGKHLLMAIDMVAQGRWDPERLESAKRRMAKAVAEA